MMKAQAQPQERRVANKMGTEVHQVTDIGRLFQLNRFEQIESALNYGNVSAVRQLAMAVRAEYVAAHDGFRDAVALTLAHISGKFGSVIAERIGRLDIEKRVSGGELPPYGQIHLRERVKAIAAGWHWHATRFSLSEDDEKVTFLLHPCGSGMRLITEGNYRKGPWGPPEAGSIDGRLTRSKGASWSTFMNDEFPVYCNHCSEIAHVGLANGTATFLVEGWTPARAQGICIQHTFKDIAFVPDEFYRRTDLPLPHRGELPRAVRLFTRDELIGIETHPLDKLVDRSERGDNVGARAALEECLVGWRDCIHDAYRRWLSSLWAQVHEILGPDAYEEVVRKTAPDLLGRARGADLPGWAAFWSIHLRLRSISKSTSSYDFLVGHEALLEPGVLPFGATWFVDRLNEGVAERNWTDVGRFSCLEENFLHTSPKL
jgi:hypothetical protein